MVIFICIKENTADGVYLTLSTFMEKKNKGKSFSLLLQGMCHECSAVATSRGGGPPPSHFPINILCIHLASYNMV